MKLVDTESQAYAIKLMLMQIGRVGHNMTTGARLAPWLHNIVMKIKGSPDNIPTESAPICGPERPPDGCTTIGLKRSSSSTSSMFPKKKSVLRRMPTTPSGTDSICSSEGAAPAPEYMKFWDEAEGGVRMRLGGNAAMEPCKQMVHGSNGFVECRWSDGMVWNTEVPNLRLEHLTKKPAAQPAIRRKPKVETAKTNTVETQVPNTPKGRNYVYSRAYSAKLNVVVRAGIPRGSEAARAQARAAGSAAVKEYFA